MIYYQLNPNNTTVEGFYIIHPMSFVIMFKVLLLLHVTRAEKTGWLECWPGTRK